MLDCMKKRNSKGFTLAELLVVVAIIAILVAVSIPIFTGKLDEAKKNTDLANVRAAKAAAINEFLKDQSKYEGENKPGYQGVYDAKSGTMKEMNDLDTITPYGQTDATKNGILRINIGYPEGTKELTLNDNWVYIATD